MGQLFTTASCDLLPVTSQDIYSFATRVFANLFEIDMDLPHNPTCPEQLYQQVQKEVKDLWVYIQNRQIPAISSEIRWKKQPYGGNLEV